MSKQRWKDTLPLPYEPSLAKAASCIASAIEWKNPPGYYEGLAAAHIRAYRKTLGVKTERDVAICSEQDSDEQVFVAGVDCGDVVWSTLTHACPKKSSSNSQTGQRSHAYTRASTPCGSPTAGCDRR